MKPNKIKGEFEKKFVHESKEFGWIIEMDNAEVIWEWIEKSLDQQRKELREKVEKMKVNEDPIFHDCDEVSLTRAESYNRAISDILKEL